MNHTPVIVIGVRDRHVIIQTLDGRQFPLPRICFKIELAKGAGSMTRRQYPLRPAYAGTFHSAQGATLLRCVVDVRKSPFVHGQLYSALARVQGRASLRILIDADHCDNAGVPLTRNIVWKELLLPSFSGATGLRKRPVAAPRTAPAKHPARAP